MIVLWVLTSAAIVKFFRTEEHDVHPFKAIVAPVISGLGLLWIVSLLIKNWDIQTGMPNSWASYLPLTVFAVLAIGFVLPTPRGSSAKPASADSTAAAPKQGEPA